MTPQIAAGRVTVLWNVKSGWDAGEEQAEAVREILERIANEVEIRQVQGRDIRELAEQSIREGATVLIAAGGDGTINAVASVAAKHNSGSRAVRLGVIPSGTLNHFARDLGIAIDPEMAARQIETGRELAVDLGSVNGRIFINNSGLGLYPLYRAARRALERKGIGRTAVGRFLTVIGGIIRVFSNLPTLRLRLSTRGEVVERNSAFVLIANNEHDLEKDRIGKRTSLTSGQLWVYVLRPCSRWQILYYFFLYILGSFDRSVAFEEFVAKEVRIETRRKRIGVNVDGEIVHLRSPLNYRSLPGALRVIVPADSPIS